MPKIIELTVEIDVQRVSCPGVWLCQDGRVSLTVFALGTSYQTCMLPPMFPLTFKDVFYFRKRFEETCALNNICCLLRDETIYCELLQWTQDCLSSECVLLAQYLGSLNEVLFPPNMCSSDGVDLLMRRTKDFPGILSPKIEITTKVRIDEVWNETYNATHSSLRIRPCHCASVDGNRQKPVCHSALYHRSKCHSPKRVPSITKCTSRSVSTASRSCCSLKEPRQEPKAPYCCPSPVIKSGVRMPSPPMNRNNRRRDYCVYNMEAPNVAQSWRDAVNATACECDDDERTNNNDHSNLLGNEDRLNKVTLESRYIGEERQKSPKDEFPTKRYAKINIKPCVCEICRRYHELFHTDCTS